MLLRLLALCHLAWEGRDCLADFPLGCHDDTLVPSPLPLQGACPWPCEGRPVGCRLGGKRGAFILVSRNATVGFRTLFRGKVLTFESSSAVQPAAALPLGLHGSTFNLLHPAPSRLQQQQQQFLMRTLSLTKCKHTSRPHHGYSCFRLLAHKTNTS